MTAAELFSAVATLSGLLFVVASTLGTGLSLSVGQIDIALGVGLMFLMMILTIVYGRALERRAPRLPHSILRLGAVIFGARRLK
jgi:hypothetical protein